ncbi:MAG TPA: response regulator [Opitutaceae bacterium]|nr:response regulator [Opitutaceae bacterium]
MSGVVLYAEDDENDAFLIRHCWRKLGIDQALEIVPDGERAIEYLSRQERPKLVLLDLNMPRVGGMEVLRWVRGEPHLAGLPVAILSSSNQKKDLEGAQILGADAYFVKPASVLQLTELVAGMRQRWLG